MKKVKGYLRKKHQTIPPNMQSSFLSRLSDLLMEGYTFHESVTMLLPFHVKDSETVSKRIIDVQRDGLNIVDVFKLLGFPSRLLLPLNLASVHGQLQQTIAVLSVNTAFFENAKKRLNNLLLYPLFLFSILFLLFTMFRIYFLPNMESLIGSRGNESSDNSLTWTGYLLQMPNIFIVTTVICSIVVIMSYILLKKLPIERQLFIYLKLPIVRTWYRLLLTRVFAREIGGLMESGMSLQQSFEALISQQEQEVLQFIGKEMKEKVVHGESFSQAVFLLDSFTTELFHFVVHGENSGYLGRELSLYSEFLSQEIERKLSRYISIVQPTLFLILAVFIIGAYLAILMPIYNMINIV
ncbi:competence type IV pilus assembly protein ComGB [Psychrobacillus antarcticus]|uniref:competence type IV pilus assembly protein ComGB n=1 Tax=Psychrobacillus antarcticus TaxID=2879115 RepID=UPI0024087D57|nr:competence type IV pilus assembly protein ComGB [Psychrobacillus antarcticus]